MNSNERYNCILIIRSANPRTLEHELTLITKISESNTQEKPDIPEELTDKENSAEIPRSVKKLNSKRDVAPGVSASEFFCKVRQALERTVY